MSHDDSASHLIIGLTGGIGSGKSTVANLFASLGVRIIDTDQISHQLTQTNGAAIPLIRETFGATFIDQSGALDRAKMREHIFTFPSDKKRLEAILHPAILQEVKNRLAQATDALYTVIVVPLLFEAGNYQELCKRVVAVDCPEEVQMSRTMQRSQLKYEQVQAIISHQISRTERLARTDDVIHNEQRISELGAQVMALHQNYSLIAHGSN